MKNSQVAKALRDIGFLTEVEDGDNAQFKARAYYKAADTIASLPENIGDIYSKSGIDGLLAIPTVGKAIAAKIEEYAKTGQMRHLEELKAKIPINVDEMYGIEGIGPKTIKALYEKLQVKNLADLERAAAEGRLRKVAGFTEKKEQDIAKRVAFFKKDKGRRIIGEVYPLVKQIEARLLQIGGVKKATAAGSFRRMKETIGDIDYIVAADDPEKVMKFFVAMPEVDEVIGMGPAKAFVRLAGGIDADLLVVPEESWGSALQYFTGSKEHSVELRRIAIAKGLRLNEWGIYRGEERVAGATEEQVYQALGLQWIPPEMRENAGEIELARQGRLPELIEYGSLKGDLQVHSENTDGTMTIEEMARAARQFGLDYIAITDHTKSLTITGGLDEDELLEQADRIAELNDRLEGFRVLASAEVNIMKDGSLDIANNVLDKLDVVGAAIHSNFNLPVEVQTERLVQAAKNPGVDILFHPTGRLINKREGYPVDIEKVVETALDTNTVLEIDAHYDRLEGFRVLASAEVNIMKDGSLDIANNVLDKLDVVGAAIHSNFNLPIEVQTERLIKAAKNPSVDILFHPTGRLINKREGYPVDIEKVVETALDTNTVLEIDAHYDRLDLKDEYVRMAVRKGVKLMIDSDAHHPVHYAYLVFGIAQARRGWATASDVLNTLPADKLLEALK